jgi:putative transposase
VPPSGKDTISRITEKVCDEMAEWANRPLDRVCPVIMVGAIHMKVRDGQVRAGPSAWSSPVSVNGERDILGIWSADSGEGAKFWLGVLTEVKNRGVEDVCIAVYDLAEEDCPMRSPPSGSSPRSRPALFT